MPTIPDYKTIVELLKKGMTVEAQEKIMELREIALVLREENIKLKERLQDIQARIEAEQSVQWDAPYYWIVRKEGRDGPFCQHCYDSNKKLIHLQTEVMGCWECHACGKHVFDSTYKSVSPLVVPDRSFLDGLDTL